MKSHALQLKALHSKSFTTAERVEDQVCDAQLKVFPDSEYAEKCQKKSNTTNLAVTLSHGTLQI